MPRFQDATGYLLELRNTVNEGWFSALCDMALDSNGQAPTSEQLTNLWSLLHGLQAYTPAAAAVAPATADGMSSFPVFLGELSGFKGFKKLSPGLSIQLDKQVCLIFGKNGSGKSSICQALKLLANPEKPMEPLHNAHSNLPAAPSFDYRFIQPQIASTWALASGFGTHSQSIKYFDSTVALRHTTGDIRPEVAVEISVFRLEVFEYARTLIKTFQRHALSQVDTEITRLRTLIDELKERVKQSVSIVVDPFLGWSPINSAPMVAWLSSLPIFDTAMEATLANLTTNLEQHIAASSDEGLKALRAQLTLVGQLENKLSELNQYCIAAPLNTLQTVESQLLQKRATILELSKEVFPTDVDPTQHQALVASASVLTNFADATADSSECPLCRQTLGPHAEALFRAYHAHLTSTLQDEIRLLDETLKVGIENLEWIYAFELGDFTACQDSLPRGFLDTLGYLIKIVRDSVLLEGKSPASGDATAYARSNELAQHLITVSASKKSIETAIKNGTENKAVLDTKIKQFQEQIGQLRAHQTVCANRQEILALCNESQAFFPFVAKVRALDFPTLLRNMTNIGKEAHTDLVLRTFEQQLDEEYLALSGMTLRQMGVRLASRGDNQDVIVTPHVGNAPVYRVLSEGEQKVHSLAVFMCEAASSPHQVLVFDDPVTSFDYNYISNFCERLRDLIKTQIHTQVIVLTHNWDFFVNLQTIINRTHGLNARLSVQVLEDCATVSEYSEKWDELCQQIEFVVLATNEPSADEKERISGLMRRLIERLTNAYVFNEQRHQFKVKSLKVSEFRLFTKIVPLLTQEADELRDLYSNLSPPEHDDVRNYYVTKSRIQFKAWYDNIVVIKKAVEARKP